MTGAHREGRLPWPVRQKSRSRRREATEELASLRGCASLDQLETREVSHGIDGRSRAPISASRISREARMPSQRTQYAPAAFSRVIYSANRLHYPLTNCGGVRSMPGRVDARLAELKLELPNHAAPT